MLVAFVATGALLAIVQLSIAFKDWLTRLDAVGAIGAAALPILFGAGDVHAVAAGGVLMLSPLCVLIARRAIPISMGWLPLAILIGGLGETLNLIRSQSGTGPLIAVVAVLLIHRATAFRIRALLVGSVALASVAVAYLGATTVMARDAYIAAQRTDYRPIVAVHPFWHSVYIGFGFLSNPMGLAYKDDVAIAAASRIDPASAAPTAEEWQFNWPAHEKALRKATFNFFEEHTFFAVKTIFAQFGVIQLFVLLFGNFGLLGIKRLAVSSVRIPVGTTLAFSAMPGILAQPNFNYLAAFSAAITVAAVVGLGLIRERKNALMEGGKC